MSAEPKLTKHDLQHLVFLIDEGRAIEPGKCGSCERLAANARADLERPGR